MSRKRKRPSRRRREVSPLGGQVWDAELEAERLIAEAAAKRRLEMNPLWVQANTDPSWKPFLASEAQASRADIPKDQHYIPRFWLLGFADPPTKAGKVSAVDLTGENRTSRIGTKRAATERHFYTLTGPDEQPNPLLEDLLGHIEDKAAPAFKKIANGCLQLSPVERLSVALLLAAQVVRTPTHIRGVIQQAVNDIGRKLILQGQDLGVLPPMEGGFTVTSSDEYAVGMALDGEALGDMALTLFCRRWSLFKASTDSGGFVLPERPVVMWSGVDRGFYGPGGVLNAHWILVPVDRQFLLVMHWTEWKDDSGSFVHDLSAERVHALNAYLCAASGGRTVFCNPLDTPNVEEIRSIALNRLQS